jgi:hypothetical protein
MKTKSAESGREIEKKYRVKNFGYLQTLRELKEDYEIIDEDVSRDIFFKSEGNDFVRLRENTKELTVKRTDRETTVNRLELNLKLKGSFEFHRVWAETVFGNQVGELLTVFAVFRTTRAIISLYRVSVADDVFLEIEVGDENDIQSVEDDLKYLGLEREHRSLFQIFFGS